MVNGGSGERGSFEKHFKSIKFMSLAIVDFYAFHITYTLPY